ncbi:hypothetical protein ACFFRR_005909 [Megaselia abdita]
MAKPKSSTSAKISTDKRSKIGKPKPDKSCEISASVKKQFKVLSKPSVIHKAIKDSECVNERSDNAEGEVQKRRPGRPRKVVAEGAKDPQKVGDSEKPKRNARKHKVQEEPIKKFFSAKEKTYKIPTSPNKSNDIYDFLSLTNKAERRQSDPILKKIIAKKNVDLKVYKNGKIRKVRKKHTKAVKLKEASTNSETSPSPVEDAVFENTAQNFSFNNVVNSTPANSDKRVVLAPKTPLTIISSPTPESLSMTINNPVNLKTVSFASPVFKSPPLKNDLRRNAILNSNRQHTAAEKRQLLEQARKMIPRMSSTPVRKTTVSYTPKALSPIAPLVNSTMRVENEENCDLPHLNYFGRSSDLTPSYSSDVIPQTPQKPHSTSIINNSNEENIPPPNVSQNDSMTITEKPIKRVPFKEIVILQNDTLPNWTNNASKPSDYDDLDEVIQKRNSEMYQPHKSYSKRTSGESKIAMDINNCFGFDDLINCNSPAKKQPNGFEEANTTHVHELMSVLKDQRDGRLINEKIIFATPRKTHKPVPNLFSPPREIPKQNIKEMISKSRKEQSKSVVDETLDDNSDFIDQSQRLFKDPESSFDSSKLHETYRAPVKRSRKIKKLNEFVYDFESGDSDEENVESPVKRAKKRKKKNDSRETAESEDEESHGKKPAKKIKKTKHDDELEHFCELLNAEFAEVERIEIPVECE